MFTVAVRVVDAWLEDLFAGVPPCTTVKASDVGENPNVGVAVTESLTGRVVVV